MMIRELTPVEGVAAAALAVAGFVIGYATPVGGFLVMLLVVAFAIDVFFDATTGGFSSVVAAGLSKLAQMAWSPVDKATSTALRLWAWRSPGLSSIGGFLVAWVQSYSSGGN